MSANIIFLTFILWIRLSMSLKFRTPSDEWASPYVLRVISYNRPKTSSWSTRRANTRRQNSKIDGLYVTKTMDTYTPGRISGIKVDPKKNVSDAYLLYPEGAFYSPQTYSKNSATLFDSEYGTPYNASQLLVVGTRRNTYGNPDYFNLVNDYGPGVLHLWPAATTVAAFGWRFQKDNETGKEYLRSDSFDDGWKWLGYSCCDDTWYMNLWNCKIYYLHTGFSLLTLRRLNP